MRSRGAMSGTTTDTHTQGLAVCLGLLAQQAQSVMLSDVMWPETHPTTDNASACSYLQHASAMVQAEVPFQHSNIMLF